MRPLLLIAISLSVGTAAPIARCDPASDPRAEPCRRLPPITIALTPVPARAGDADELRRLRVSATPLLEARQLEVSVTLPAGARLVGGEREWLAPVRLGIAESREIAIHLPSGGGQRVGVTARLLFQRTLPLGCAASHTFGAHSLSPHPAAR